jgi:hypothetical protein
MINGASSPVLRGSQRGFPPVILRVHRTKGIQTIAWLGSVVVVTVALVLREGLV